MKGYDWLKLDNTMTDNPKLVSCSLEARWAWLEMLCYASRNTTDGEVPDVIARRFAAPEILQELRHALLTHHVRNSWWINDFLDHNPSKADIEEYRSKASDRSKRYRERHA